MLLRKHFYNSLSSHQEGIREQGDTQKEILSTSDTVRSLRVYRNLHNCFVEVGVFSYTNDIYTLLKGDEFKY